MTSAAPAILALETDSAWFVILAVSLVTLVAVVVLHRLIGRPGGLASGILLSLPLALPLVAGFIYEQAVLPEISILQPAGRAVLEQSESLLRLLLVDDGKGRDFVLYALTGSAGPYLVLIGGAVSSFMLLRRLTGWLLLRRVVGQSTPLHPTEHQDVLSVAGRLAARAGLRRTPEVLVLPRGRVGAFATGGRRPRVLISDCVLETLELEEIEGLLAHELAHIRSRDVQIVMAAGFLRDLVAWNPVAHVAFKRLTSNRELEADRKAAELTGDPLAVASGLVKMCEVIKASGYRSGAALAFLRPKTRITRRVTALLALADGNRAVAGPSPASLYAGAAVLAILLGLQVGAHITEGESGAFAIVIGESGDAERWDSHAGRAQLQHRPSAEVGARKAMKVQAGPKPMTPYAQVLSLRMQELERWRVQIMEVARRRGIPAAELFLGDSPDLEAVPLVGADSPGQVAIYRLKEIR